MHPHTMWGEIVMATALSARVRTKTEADIKARSRWLEQRARHLAMLWECGARAVALTAAEHAALIA